MTSSSSRRRLDAPSGETSAAESLARLLSVIADEIARMAEDVVRLGEIVSQDAAASGRPIDSYDLQAFDIFAQSASAQARLLKRLSQSDVKLSALDIAMLISDVPFADMRKRLHAASAGTSGDSNSAEEDSDDGQVSWLWPPAAKEEL